MELDLLVKKISTHTIFSYKDWCFQLWSLVLSDIFSHFILGRVETTEGSISYVVLVILLFAFEFAGKVLLDKFRLLVLSEEIFDDIES